MKRIYRRFTDAEIAIIREKYATLGGVGLAPILSRPSWGIAVVARRLGLKRERRWTPEREREFAARYPVEGASPALCAAMGCDHPAPLTLHAQWLGIRYLGKPKRFSGRKHHSFKGYKSPDGDTRFDVPATVISILRSGQKRGAQRWLPIEIDEAYISFVLRQQNGLCRFTGDPVSFTDKTASIDRIDSSKGYIHGNVQITTVLTNLMKNDFTDTEVIEWCKRVVTTHGRKKEAL